MPQELKLRSMLTSGKGKVLIACDFKQGETWVVAHKANEQKMMESLHNGDIHTETAANALFHVSLLEVSKDMRYLGKRFNHASSYRMGYERAAQVINKDSDKPPYISVSLREAREYSEAWLSYYSLQSWWDGIVAQLNTNRTLTNTYGRRMVFNGNWNEQLHKAATAWEPQSTLADHANGVIHPELGVTGGFLEVYKQLVKKEKAGKIVNQSHDSIVFETEIQSMSEMVERIPLLLRRPLVVNGYEFIIPVDVETGERYGELKEWSRKAA